MSKVLETLLETRTTASEELETRREALMGELEQLAHDSDGNARTLTEEETTRSGAILAEIDQIDAEVRTATKAIDKRIKEERKRAKVQKRIDEARGLLTPAPGASVTSEPMVYGVDKDGVESPNSYYGDLCRRALFTFTGNDGGATQRLSEWAHQVEVEVGEGSKIGKAAEVQLRELNREFGEQAQRARLTEIRERGKVAIDAKTADLEMRTAGTTVSGGGATASSSGGGGSAFVTPVFYVPDYAKYKELGRAFADQLNKHKLPDYGMNVYIPAVEEPIKVAEQATEGTTVEESQSKFGYLSAALKTEAGQQYVTQQLLDRAGPNFAFDVMIFDQLEIDYGKKIDVAALEAALTSAKENNSYNSAKFQLYAKGEAGGFAGQVAKAKADMRKLEGTILNPTHLFVSQTRWEYMASIADEYGRPLVNPGYGAPSNSAAAGNASGDEGVEGDTGFRLSGLPVFQDGNIVKSGTLTGTAEQEQAIVGCLREVWFFEGPPVTRVLPQTKGNQLLVLLQRYSYYCLIKRYANAIITITGTAMNTAKTVYA